mgnify:CR=1 FL=1
MQKRFRETKKLTLNHGNSCLYLLSARQGPDVIILTQNVFWLVMFPNNYTFLLYLFKVLFLLVKSCVAGWPPQLIYFKTLNESQELYYVLVKFLFPYLLSDVTQEMFEFIHFVCFRDNSINSILQQKYRLLLPNLTLSNQLKWNLISDLSLVHSAMIVPSHWSKAN